MKGSPLHFPKRSRAYHNVGIFATQPQNMRACWFAFFELHWSTRSSFGYRYLIRVMQSSLIQSHIEVVIARKLHHTLTLNTKTRSEVSRTRDFSCLKRSPDAVLGDDHDIVAGKGTQGAEMQSSTSEPLPQQLVSMTRSARTNDFNIGSR